MDTETASNEEILAQAQRVVAQIHAALPRRVDPVTISLIAKIPFKALLVRELLIHRIDELGIVACDLFEKRTPVSAFIITRALLETAASMYCLHRRVSEVIQTAQIGAVDEFLMKTLSGWKDPGAQIQAVNVLTLVDRVNRDLPHFRQAYDALSEFAHPNWSGVEGAYGEVDFQKLWVDLGHSNRVPTRTGLCALVGGLELFFHFYTGMLSHMSEFTRICEEALAGRHEPAE